MAEQKHNTVFGDKGTAPNAPDRQRTGEIPRDGKTRDVNVNDEDREPGRSRGDRPDRPSSADDMKNPRTGPIG